MKKSNKQIRHEALMDFLSQFDQYNGDLNDSCRGIDQCTKIKKTRGVNDLKKMSLCEIGVGVVLLTDFYNLGTGAALSIDLYQLLEMYFLDTNKRDAINEIVADSNPASRFYKNKTNNDIRQQK